MSHTQPSSATSNSIHTSHNTLPLYSPKDMPIYDVIIIGAGASGLYCAMTAGKRGKSVLVLDHANKAGKKILMSGGGKCNFTNYEVEPEHFIGANAHFCKSALTRYSNWAFIELVEKHNIAYHEREYGQLFCDDSAKDIVAMLLNECKQAGVEIRLNTHISVVDHIKAMQPRTQAHDGSINQESVKPTTPPPASLASFIVNAHPKLKKPSAKKNLFKKRNPSNITDAAQTKQSFACHALVIATGGLSIPTMGASGLGYDIAQQFGHRITNTEAGLVPFTFTDAVGKMIASLSGLSLDVVMFNEHISFARPLLFTHRGLSGPASLQLSNYWQVGETISINLAPHHHVTNLLLTRKNTHPKQRIRTVLMEVLPKNLVLALQDMYWADVAKQELANLKNDRLENIGQLINSWQLKPSGTEGYRTAEVTRGGVCTDDVSSKTFESTLCPNLYFIGEVLDVTGWLGGYNFQWAWASGWACGMAI